MPATLGSQKFVRHKVDEVRNYSILYDPSYYASLWVAYPLVSSHMSGNSDAENWSQDPEVADNLETNTWGGSYGVSLSTENYPNNLYGRGHQIPAADRKVKAFRDQTYYSTNMTPQIQYGFNGGIWEKLEEAIRGQASASDTLYIVTGPVYQTVNGSETVKTIVNTRDGKTLKVANYYYKVVMKVKWSSDKSTIEDAMAVGFWFEHKDYGSASDYTSHTKSVAEIETLTGISFFTNLPEGKKSKAKSNNNWTTFTNF